MSGTTWVIRHERWRRVRVSWCNARGGLGQLAIALEVSLGQFVQ